jgi:hypothetical protein
MQHAADSSTYPSCSKHAVIIMLGDPRTLITVLSNVVEEDAPEEEGATTRG